MIKLSNIVKNTKKGEYDNISPLEGGCKEVQVVYNTFAKLNKIVRISNTSFFSGKLDMAHHFMSDALTLYRKINDRKAIGVTCNNLANTLFAIQMERLDDVHCCNEENICYINQTLALYDEAMSYSQEDFDEAKEHSKVEYAIQLADRLFNRGLYFLFIDGFDCAPSDSRDRGYSDITFSRNLHDDIRDYLIENKQLFATSSTYFSRLLRRINCLAAFYDDVGLRDIWDARVLLDEAKQLVDAATEADSKGNSCPLFQEANQTGRKQQLESLEILLALNCGNNVHAARVGMRMLVEDAYLMESAFIRAAEALLCLMKEGDGNRDFCLSERSMECIRADLRTMVKSCKRESLEMGKNTMFVLEICPSKWEIKNDAVGEALEELKNQCLWLYDKFIQEDDQIGMLADILNSTQTVELGSKGKNEGRQRTFIDLATSMSGIEHASDSESPSGFLRASGCLSKGLQMLIDSSLSLQRDSYFLWVTNGCEQYEEHELISLRNQIERLNQERSYEIHVLIIDLNRLCRSLHNMDEEELGKTEDLLLGQTEEVLLREIGSVSKSSIYLNVNCIDELKSAFQSVSGPLSNGLITSEFISFLTMEKF